MPHDVRSELSALQDDLASQARSPLEQAASSVGTTPPPKEKSADLEHALRELHQLLAEAAGEAETVLAEHPLAAVAAAFILGIVTGRMMGNTR